MPYYIGVNNGAGHSGGSVTEGSSTTSKDVEVVINTTANIPSKEELVLAMQKISDYATTMSKAW